MLSRHSETLFDYVNGSLKRSKTSILVGIWADSNCFEKKLFTCKTFSGRVFRISLTRQTFFSG